MKLISLDKYDNIKYCDFQNNSLILIPNENNKVEDFKSYIKAANGLNLVKSDTIITNYNKLWENVDNILFKISIRDLNVILYKYEVKGKEYVSPLPISSCPKLKQELSEFFKFEIRYKGIYTLPANKEELELIKFLENNTNRFVYDDDVEIRSILAKLKNKERVKSPKIDYDFKEVSPCLTFDSLRNNKFNNILNINLKEEFVVLFLLKLTLNYYNSLSISTNYLIKELKDCNNSAIAPTIVKAYNCLIRGLDYDNGVFIENNKFRKIAEPFIEGDLKSVLEEYKLNDCIVMNTN